MKNPNLWVVKLGGSLLGNPYLQEWLNFLAKQTNLVIVPGGGMYAEQVRQAQISCGFDDETAHWMAIGAMNQMAETLSAMQANLVLLDRLAQIEIALTNNKVVIWSPYTLLREKDNLPHHWDVTSDSIAAWLARLLHAQHLLLVKSVCPAENQMSVAYLQKIQLLDLHFANVLQHSSWQTWVMQAEQIEQLKHHGLSMSQITDIALEVR